MNYITALLYLFILDQTYNLLDAKMINSVRESKIYENIKLTYPEYSDKETVIGSLLVVSTIILKQNELEIV